MKKNNKKVIIIVTIIILLVILTVGITYAYYNLNIIGNTKNEQSVNLTSDKLEIIYDKEEDNDVVTGNVGETENVDSYNKTFTIKSTAKGIGKYTIILDNIENDFVKTWDWTYKLYKIDTEGTETEIAEGVIGNTLKRQVIRAEEEIEAGESNKYKLEVIYDNTTSNETITETGTNLKFRINIMGANENIFKEDAQAGTLLYAIGENNEVVNPLTIPGQQVSTAEEAELSYTEDDYGTSYYYRGKVKNNYLTFGDMCWRIVRVQGDGSIKITLYDESQKCEDIKEANSTGAFIRDSSGTLYSTSYFGAPLDHVFENSRLHTNLLTWYTSKLENSESENLSIVTDAEWCNDLSVVTKGSSGELFFGAHERLLNPSTAQPSLTCNFPNKIESSSYKALKVKSKIATLTADEVVFAGSAYNLTGTSSYLAGNVGGKYLTLSPHHSHTFYTVNWGGLKLDQYNNPYSIRPAITLSKNVLIESGDGTIEKPYIVANTLQS